MATRSAKKDTGAKLGFEAKLWAAANALAWQKSLGFSLLHLPGMSCGGRRNAEPAR